MDAIIALNDKEEDQISRSQSQLQPKQNPIEAKINEGLISLEKSIKLWSEGNELTRHEVLPQLETSKSLFDLILNDALIAINRTADSVHESEISSGLLKLPSHSKRFMRVFSRVYGSILLYQNSDDHGAILQQVCFFFYIVLILNPSDIPIWISYSECLLRRGFVNSAANAYSKAIYEYEKSQSSLGITVRYDDAHHPAVSAVKSLLNMYIEAGNNAKAWNLVLHVMKKSKLTELWTPFKNIVLEKLCAAFHNGIIDETLLRDVELVKSLRKHSVTNTNDCMAVDVSMPVLETGTAAPIDFLVENLDAVLVVQNVLSLFDVHLPLALLKIRVSLDEHVVPSPAPPAAPLSAAVSIVSDDDDFETPEVSTRELRKKSARVLGHTQSQGSATLSQESPFNSASEQFALPPLTAIFPADAAVEGWKLTLSKDLNDAGTSQANSSENATAIGSSIITLELAHSEPLVTLCEFAALLFWRLLPLFDGSSSKLRQLMFRLFDTLGASMFEFPLTSRAVVVSPGAETTVALSGVFCNFCFDYYKSKLAISNSALMSSLLQELSTDTKKPSLRLQTFSEFLAVEAYVPLAKVYASHKTRFLQSDAVTDNAKQLLLAAECELDFNFVEALYYLRPLRADALTEDLEAFQSRLECFLFITDLQTALAKDQSKAIVMALVPLLFSCAESRHHQLQKLDLVSLVAELCAVPAVGCSESRNYWMLYMSGFSSCFGKEHRFAINSDSVRACYWRQFSFSQRQILRSLFRDCCVSLQLPGKVLEILDYVAFIDLIASWNDSLEFPGIKFEQLAALDSVLTELFKPCGPNFDDLSGLMDGIPDELRSIVSSCVTAAMQFALLSGQNSANLLEERLFKSSRVSAKKQDERRDCLARCLLHMSVLFVETFRLKVSEQDVIGVLERVHECLKVLERCNFLSGLLFKYSALLLCGFSTENSPLKQWWTLHLFTCASGCSHISMTTVCDSGYLVGHASAEKLAPAAVDKDLLVLAFHAVEQALSRMFIRLVDLPIQYLNAARDVAEALFVSIVPMCRQKAPFCDGLCALSKYLNGAITSRDVITESGGLVVPPISASDAVALGKTLVKGPALLALILTQSLQSVPKRERSVARVQMLRELWMCHLSLHSLDANAWLCLGNANRDYAHVFPSDKRRTVSQSLEYYKCLVYAYRCYRQYLSLTRVPANAEFWQQLCSLIDTLLRVPINGDAFLLFSPELPQLVEMDPILGFTRQPLVGISKAGICSWLVSCAMSSSISSTIPDFGKISELVLGKGDLFEDVYLETMEHKFPGRLQQTRDWIASVVKPLFLEQLKYSASQLLAIEPNVRRNADVRFMLNRNSISLFEDEEALPVASDSVLDGPLDVSLSDGALLPSSKSILCNELLSDRDVSISLSIESQEPVNNDVNDDSPSLIKPKDVSAVSGESVNADKAISSGVLST